VNTNPGNLPGPFGIARKWWVAGIGMAGVSLTELSFTILLFAGPEVLNGIDTDRYGYQWAVGPYLIMLVLGVVLAPRIQRQFGSLLPFVVGMASLGVGCLIASAANSLPQMILARVFMAAKGLPLALALAQMWAVFPRHRGLAMGFYTASMYGSVAVGGALGGFVAVSPAWRVAYLIAGAGSFGVALAALAVFVPDRPQNPAKEPWDLPGAALMAVTLAAVVMLLMRGQYLGWWISQDVWLAAGVAILSAGLFVWRELTCAAPLVNLRFLSFRTLTLTLLCLGLFGGSFMGLINSMPGYLTLRGYQTVTVGWVAVPGALVLIATLVISGAISDRVHTLRTMQGGLLIATLSLFMLLQLDLYTSKEWIAGVVCLYSVGAGMVLPTGLRLLFEGQAPEAVQQLASVKVAIRFFAIVVGFLASSIILVRGTDWNQDQLRQKITRGRPAVEQVERQLARYAREGGSAPEVASNQASALIGSWIAINAQMLGFRGVIRYLLVLSGLGFVVSLFITRGVEADILAGEETVVHWLTSRSAGGSKP